MVFVVVAVEMCCLVNWAHCLFGKFVRSVVKCNEGIGAIFGLFVCIELTSSARFVFLIVPNDFCCFMFVRES